MKNILKYILYLIITLILYLIITLILLFILVVFGILSYLAFIFGNFKLAIPLALIVILSVVPFVFCIFNWVTE